MHFLTVFCILVFQIQKEDLAFAPADEANWYGGVQSRGTMTFDILGDVFLKSVYAVSDASNTLLLWNLNKFADLGPGQHPFWRRTQD